MSASPPPKQPRSFGRSSKPSSPPVNATHRPTLLQVGRCLSDHGRMPSTSPARPRTIEPRAREERGFTLPDSWLRGILAGAEEMLGTWLDRKSTRLNSSHVAISYAVFCLNKTTNAEVAATLRQR